MATRSPPRLDLDRAADAVGDEAALVGTAVDAIREGLEFGGLLRRYDADDNMPEEGAFLACSFWLVSCLANQSRNKEAQEVFERSYGTANDLGLLSEEF